MLNQVAIGRRGIRHLHISHCTACLPPKILHKHCLQFLLGQLKYAGKMKTKGYEIFGREGGKQDVFMGDENGEYNKIGVHCSEKNASFA